MPPNNTTLVMILSKNADRLAALHQACFEQGWSVQSWQSMVETPNSYAWLATEKNHDVGLVVLRTAQETADIITLAVHPHARRRGIARHLMQTAESYAEATGVESIFLEVAHSNISAKNLYESLGYKIIDTRKSYYATSNGFEDAWVMRKYL